MAQAIVRTDKQKPTDFARSNRANPNKENTFISKLTLRDCDRLHEIALALDALRNLLAESSDSDGVSLLLEPFVRDLQDIDTRACSAEEYRRRQEGEDEDEGGADE